ncbi:protein-glutamate O-methyltransferase CheR [Nocardioides sp. TRM66260-LWL]|uniref:CheR family methyltransferase n=1 Tax=Nocardioides sp. TRM66260-LWL TaxID=2874478 RepID=UPI001CC707A8|nr:protein-glutamate O-methyltransferase CheR [Nocardioides sp. TRM66260-LWL]MBZ5735169.1 protein-glutamate O-methyltransferase CheR [Nocardioides sp. TRM66260-LWL]
MISETNFGFVADLLRRETAMLCERGKEYLVEARLLPLARQAGDPDVDHYVDRLRRDAGERARAVDALTINETSWFRDLAPYQAFVDDVLPRLLAARVDTRRLTIWSAACSSGQEAYSLAMLLDEHLPAGWTARIHATDVSPTMVERVRAGRYSQVEMNRGMPATRLVKYFQRVGSEWEVQPQLRTMVTTQVMNLAAPLPPLPTFDVVLLRNVLIYFDHATKQSILDRVQATIAEDGFLMLGSTETTLDLETTWTRESAGPAGRVVLHRPRHGRAVSRPFPDSSSPAASPHLTLRTGA